MALPLHILERLPANLRRTAEPGGAATGLALEQSELDQALPDGGLLRGGVVELAIAGGAALGTSIALAACSAAQKEGQSRGGDLPWCAFVDPTATLWGPGVAEAGVRLDRLLVVRPPLEALARVALRVVESQAFAVVAIDTVGVPGSLVDISLGAWPRIVRRLSMAIEGTSACVLLVTDSSARRPLPLPVAQRIELSRLGQYELRLRVAKDKLGRVSSPRSIAWQRPTGRPLTKIASPVPPVRDHEARHALRLSHG